MYTQCPHCLTLFRIHPEQLSAANGQAHCCRCHQIFSALDNLQEQKEEGEVRLVWPDSIPTEILDDPAEASAAETKSNPVDDSREVQIDQGDDAHEEADPSPAGEEAVDTSPDDAPRPVNLAQFLSNGKGKIKEITPSKASLKEGGTLPFRVPRNLQEISASEQPAISTDIIHNGDRPTGRRTFTWSLLILLLLLAALLQLSWFGREHLMRYPEGRQLLELACRHIDCQLPLRKATDKIIVTDRAISVHPDVDNALLVEIRFSNQAIHPQPYPALQLSFYSNDEQLAAQRVFLPADYLQRPSDRKGAFPPKAEVQAQLELKDPGEEITGFKFDFL